MYDILTIGDIKLDDFVQLPVNSSYCKLKKKENLLCIAFGEKISVHDSEPQIAGSAPNVAVGLSRQGYSSAIYSIMGEDEITDMAFVKLGREGVDTRLIKIKKGTRSSSSIVLNYKGQRTILASHRAYEYNLPRINHTQWMYIGEIGAGYESLYKKINYLIKKKGIKLGINPGAIQINEKKKVLYDLLENTEILFLNKEEAIEVSRTKSTDLKHIMTKLWKMGPNTVVVTDGARGAYAFDGGDIVHCPSFPTTVIEATGAGDSFATGFVGALMADKKIDCALRWGSVNSASVISKIGPQPGLLTKSKIQKQIRNNKSFKTHVLEKCTKKCNHR